MPTSAAPNTPPPPNTKALHVIVGVYPTSRKEPNFLTIRLITFRAGYFSSYKKEVIMRALNGLLGVVLGILGAVAGVVLGIIASLVWIVGLVLCLTILLIPLGIPVMKLGRRLLGLSGDLMHLS
jgi:hypothetical protein